MRYAECHPDRKHYGKGQCRPCYMRTYNGTHHAHIAAKKRGYYRADPRRYIDNTRKALYGISGEEYRDLVIGQAGRCLICGRVPRRNLVVDHDHATGKVRGLLCHLCNQGLGALGDDPSHLSAALRYLASAP